ncbi:helix-turn-helix transcriptional regulator [Tissierella praeacuta]|uniref:helix-turn-helix domain-containing protein n=1 Tax=Tissierella praeacuta TaxID=43131 RepID=UPI003517EF89
MYKDRWDYKMERMKKKIPLRDIAKYIKCSITLLSKYENGERNMSNDKVEYYRYYIESTENK